MRLSLAAFLAAALLWPLPGIVAEHAAEEWVVVLKDPRPERRKGWSSGVGYSGTYNYADDPKLGKLARDLARDYQLTVTKQWPIRALNVHCVVVKLDPGDPVPKLEALRGDSRVEWVQPLNEFEALATSGVEDPYRHLQNSLDVLNVAPVHEALTGDGVRIAMIDSGVEPDHPDIAPALRKAVDFVGQGSLSERHGTGIAGVIVAASRNGVGISGVAPGAGLYAYRACWETAEGGTRCNSLTLSLALDHAITVEPDVVNLSLTGPSDRLLDALVGRLVEDGSIVVVAWDDKRGVRRFPSGRPGVLFVRDGTGIEKWQDDTLYAPGNAVLTAQPGHGYDYMGGSSLAAAHVSGVLALLLESDPAMTPLASEARLAGSIRRHNDGASVDACHALDADPSNDRCSSALRAAGN